MNSEKVGTKVCLSQKQEPNGMWPSTYLHNYNKMKMTRDEWQRIAERDLHSDFYSMLNLFQCQMWRNCIFFSNSDACAGAVIVFVTMHDKNKTDVNIGYKFNASEMIRIHSSAHCFVLFDMLATKTALFLPFLHAYITTCSRIAFGSKRDEFTQWSIQAGAQHARAPLSFDRIIMFFLSSFVS